MDSNPLRSALVLACVSVGAVAAALVLDGDSRWLAYPLLVVGGATFIPAVVGLVVWWTGVEELPVGGRSRSRWRNALLAVLFTGTLVVHVHSVFVLGQTRGWTDELSMFVVGASLVGIAQSAGRTVGRELGFGEA